MIKDLDYDVVEVGEEFGPLEHSLDAGIMEKYLKGSENQHPWHRDDSPFGAAIAPPGMLGNLTLRLFDTKYFLKMGTLHAKQELEFYNPVRLDRKLISRGTVTDKYIRRGREWIVFEAEFSDEEGTRIARSKVVTALPSAQAAGEKMEERP